MSDQFCRKGCQSQKQVHCKKANHTRMPAQRIDAKRICLTPIFGVCVGFLEGQRKKQTIEHSRQCQDAQHDKNHICAPGKCTDPAGADTLYQCCDRYQHGTDEKAKAQHSTLPGITVDVIEQKQTKAYDSQNQRQQLRSPSLYPSTFQNAYLDAGSPCIYGSYKTN